MRYQWVRRGEVTADGPPIARIRVAYPRGAEATFGPAVWRCRMRGDERVPVRAHDTEPTYVARHDGA